MKLLSQTGKEKIMTLAKLTKVLNLIGAGMMVLGNIDSEEQSLATTRKSLKYSILRLQRVL